MSFSFNVPAQFRAGAEASAAVFYDLDNVIVSAHINLDGDALGSLAACGYILKNMNKTFGLYSSTGIPQHLDFLNLPGPVYQTISEMPFEPACAIFLDCNDIIRLGHELLQCASIFYSINIDHHIGGRGLGSVINYIDSNAAATAQLAAYVAMMLKMPLEGNMAEAIALGLMTDTGGFCHGNTTADVFSLCSILAANGCSFYDLREKLQDSWTINRIKLWGMLFERLTLEYDKKIAFSAIYKNDFVKYHCNVDDTEGIADRFRTIRGVKVAALLREEKENTCKFSLRSSGNVDVRSMAAEFGGGGHFNAAGGIIKENPENAKKILLDIICRHLAKMEKEC